jgi:2-(1,2-epoxy-1,2-dihydrophenyl)acetyl-CoA isomerase
MAYSEIAFDVSDGIATITLNRPDTRNALGDALRSEFADATAEIAARAGKEIKAAVLTGAGRAFCSGGDINVLKEMAGKGPDAMRARMQAAHEIVAAWIDLPIPTVAAVNGAAAGAGFTLAIACDFAIAAHDARFVMSFGRIGLVPDWGAMYLLPRIVGMQRARDLVFTARALDAETARNYGLVLEIVDAGDLQARARAFAGKFVDASPDAIGLAKRIMNVAFETPRAEAFAAEADAQAAANATDYHRDAVARFLAKEPLAFDWER